MAEGLLGASGGQRFEVASAGTHPTDVNPLAIRVMREIGIDISPHRSKPVDEMIGREFDYVVTVCDNARESCPVFPGDAKRIHWSFEDPAEAVGTEEDQLWVFRRVRDEIADRVSAFAGQVAR